MSFMNRVRIAFLWLLVALCVVGTLVLFLDFFLTPQDGISMGVFDFSDEGLRVNRVLPGGTELIREDDVIININSVPVDQMLRMDDHKGLVGADGQVVYDILRTVNQGGSGRDEQHVSVTPGRLPVLRVLLRAPGLTLLSLAFLVVGCFVFIRRQADGSAQLFLIISMHGFILITELLDYPVITLTRPVAFWSHFAGREFVGLLGPAAAIGLPLIFPRRINWVEQRKRWLFPLVATLVIMPPVLAFALSPAGLTRQQTYGNVSAVVLAASLLSSLGLWIFQSSRASDPVSRAQLRWVAWGAAIGLLPLMALYLIPTVLGWSPLVPFDVLSIGLLVIPLAFGIAVARYRLWNIVPLARSAVVDGMPDGVVVLGLRHHVMDANPAIRDILGAPPEDILRADFMDLLPGHADEAQQLLAQTDVRLEMTLNHSIEPRVYDVRSSALYDRSNEMVGRSIVFRDITRRKQAELALQQMVEELDAFAHTVAHDLKNPLHVLTMNVELVRAQFPDMPESISKRLQTMQATGFKMSSIINALLLLSSVRMQEGLTYDAIDTGKLVRDTLVRFENLIEEHRATISQPEEWPLAVGYGPWVEEIWANYISNAIKYGGRPPHIAVGADSAGDGFARFWVRDNGEGLTPEQQSTLFAEFTRLGETQVEGHGLGLSIVKRIVHKLGGSAGVESEVGKGSLFFFTLPAASHDAEATATVEQ